MAKCKKCGHEVKLIDGILWHYNREALKLSEKCYYCKCPYPEAILKSYKRASTQRKTLKV